MVFSNFGIYLLTKRFVHIRRLCFLHQCQQNKKIGYLLISNTGKWNFMVAIYQVNTRSFFLTQDYIQCENMLQCFILST